MGVPKPPEPTKTMKEINEYVGDGVYYEIQRDGSIRAFRETSFNFTEYPSLIETVIPNIFCSSYIDNNRIGVTNTTGDKK